MEEKHNFSQAFFLVFAVVVILVVLTGWYFRGVESKPFYTQLLEKNKDFAHAESLLKSQKYDEAAEYFKLALEQAEGSKEEGQLKYKVALSDSRGSNPIEGIRLFKEVASNASYTPMIRAYAVQSIGGLLYSYNTPEVRDEVFKDEPYTSFFIEGDYSLALRRLFEYSSSFYPLGVSELRIAKWYANEILRLSKIETSDEDTNNRIRGMKIIVGQKLSNADAYLTEIAQDEQVRAYTPEVLYRKGGVLADLYLAGDESFGDPEVAYRQSISFVGNSPSAEAAAKLGYAVFLAKMYGEARLDDIRNLLSDFYSGTKYMSTATVRSVGNQKDDMLGSRDSLLLLAELDLQFAQFLRTLGWVI